MRNKAQRTERRRQKDVNSPPGIGITPGGFMLVIGMLSLTVVVIIVFLALTGRLT